MTAPPVVIVGAGPSGVTAATLLAQHGIEVLVLDRWSDVYPQPRAVHLDDEIYRVIARLGVAEEFARISRPSAGLRLQDARHRVFAQFQRRGSTGIHGFPQANMFDQPDLEVLLRAAMHRQPLVTFRGDVDVTAVRQDDEGAHVDYTDTSTGATKNVLASYVLGCDGANSIVRTSIGARMRDLRFEQRWLVVDVNTDHDLRQWEGVHQVCDTNRAATYMRKGDRQYRWEFQLKDGERSEDFARMTALRPLIAPWIGDVPDGDLEIVRLAEYTFRAQLADRWWADRVFLLGDAAHLTPPFIGQGMGAGLRDAANLSWKLAGVIDGTLPESVLDTYQRERRPHAAAMIRLAMIVGAAMTRGGHAGDLLRRLIAPRLHMVPGMRAKILDGTTPRLRPGSLVHRRRWQRGLVGTLCPNTMVDGSRRFDDVADGSFVLVTSDPGEVETGGVLALHVQRGEPLFAWLQSGRVVAALVRPDGTVMAAGSRDEVLGVMTQLRSGYSLRLQ
jgi:3-(3-hydroxy-phenyl)propionate hydroxylase